MHSLRFEESSRERSNHCTDSVYRGFSLKESKNLAKPHSLSLCIGLRLWGIAEEPTCFSAKGSSISLRWARRRMSVANLCEEAAKLLRTDKTRMSCLRV